MKNFTNLAKFLQFSNGQRIIKSLNSAISCRLKYSAGKAQRPKNLRLTKKLFIQKNEKSFEYGSKDVLFEEFRVAS